MMELKKTKFTIAKEDLRPFFKSVKCNRNNKFDCLLDSGAELPVWCASLKSLKTTFPSAERQPDMKAVVTGFGAGFSLADVYLIPELEICNGKDSLIFRRFYLPILSRRNFGADLILPSHLFRDSNIILRQSDSASKKILEFQSENQVFRTIYSKREVTAEQLEKWKALIKKLRVQSTLYFPDPDSLSDSFTLIDREGKFSSVLSQDALDVEEDSPLDDPPNDIRWTNAF